MIMERRVGVSPVAVLTALLIGGALWGLIGAILAILPLPFWPCSSSSSHRTTSLSTG
jgi:hypothetical protein